MVCVLFSSRLQAFLRYSMVGVILLFVIGRSERADGQVSVLRDVTLIDGRGGTPRHHVNLVLAGDRIQSVTSASAPVPAGAIVVDVSGKTIMPELINAHGHLGLLKGTTMSSANYTEDNVRSQLLRYQAFGVGAVLVLGTDQDQAYRWREESHAGKIPGAVIYTAGIGFGVKDGAPPISFGMDHVFRPETAEEARKDVRLLAPNHPDVVKIWVDDFFGQYQRMKPEIYTAIIDEAHKHGLRVAAHVYHADDARRLVDAGLDIIAHSVRDAEISNALLAKMKKNHVVYIPTLSLDEFAYIYGDDPAWLHQPFFRASLEPGVYEMITSPEYKQKLQSDKKTQRKRRPSRWL